MLWSKSIDQNIQVVQTLSIEYLEFSIVFNMNTGTVWQWLTTFNRICAAWPKGMLYFAAAVLVYSGNPSSLDSMLSGLYWDDFWGQRGLKPASSQSAAKLLSCCSQIDVLPLVIWEGSTAQTDCRLHKFMRQEKQQVTNHEAVISENQWSYGAGSKGLHKKTKDCTACMHQI